MNYAAEQIPAAEAFDRAIAARLLSANEADENFAGAYMFMGVERRFVKGVAFNFLGFKHRDTRKYVWVKQ